MKKANYKFSNNLNHIIEYIDIGVEVNRIYEKVIQDYIKSNTVKQEDIDGYDCDRLWNNAERFAKDNKNMLSSGETVQGVAIADYINSICNARQFILRNKSYLQKIIMLCTLIELEEVNSDYYDWHWSKDKVKNLNGSAKKGHHYWYTFSETGRDRISPHLRDKNGLQKSFISLFGKYKTGTIDTCADKSDIDENSESNGETSVLHCLLIYKDYYKKLLKNDNYIMNNRVSSNSLKEKYDILLDAQNSSLLDILNYELWGTCTKGTIFRLLFDKYKEQTRNEQERKLMCNEIKSFQSNIWGIREEFIRVLVVNELLYPIVSECVSDMKSYLEDVNKVLREKECMLGIENIFCELLGNMFAAINSTEYKEEELLYELKYSLLYRMGYLHDDMKKLYSLKPKDEIDSLINGFDLHKSVIDFSDYYKDLSEAINGIRGKEDILFLCAIYGINKN